MDSESSLFDRVFFLDPFRIEKLVTGGDGLARYEGKVVFVPLVLPGELVTAQTGGEGGSYRAAEVRQIIEPSPHRREAPCPVYGICGGCNLQHAVYSHQLTIKSGILRDTLARIGGLEEHLRTLPEGIETVGGAEFGYRGRVQLHRAPDGRYGYCKRRSNEVVPVDRCAIAVEEINAILCDPARYGLSGRRVRVFALPSGWHESSSRAQKNGNWRVIWGAAGEPAARRRFISVPLCGQSFLVPLEAFFQTNLAMLSRLIENEIMPLGGERAIDLYSGVGVFAAFLARSFKRVVAVESNRAASKAARANLAGTCAQFESSSVERLPARRGLQRDDVVVVDPPRNGLSKTVVRMLSRTRVRSLIYVSCNPATLARDLGALVGAGYRVRRIRWYDFYPQTAEIETVVHLASDALK